MPYRSDFMSKIRDYPQISHLKKHLIHLTLKGMVMAVLSVLDDTTIIWTMLTSKKQQNNKVG